MISPPRGGTGSSNNSIASGTAAGAATNTSASFLRRWSNDRGGSQDGTTSAAGGAPPMSGAPVRSVSGSDTSIRSSGNQKSLNFFRHVMGQRNQDYRATTATESRNQISDDDVRNTGNPANPAANAFIAAYHARLEASRARPEERPTPFRQWVWPGFARRDLFLRIVSNNYWKNAFIVCTIVNLFGAQVRDLLLPNEADRPLDYIFTFIFVFFVVDILLRLEIEPGYAPNFGCCRIKNETDERAALVPKNPYRGNAPGAGGGGGAGFVPPGTPAPSSDSLECQFGSFVFWCEVLATAVVLYDLTYINHESFSEKFLRIDLDRFGIPVNGLDEVNRPSPVEFELELLITIARTARVARFIRSGSAVKLTSKIQWVWLFHIFNPFKVWELATTRIPPLRRFKSMVTGKASTFNAKKKRREKLMRENDWGSLSIGLSALIRQNRRTPEEKAEEERKKKSLKGRTIRLLRFLGILPNDMEMWRREVAATKIQRAWRAVLKQRHVEDDSCSHSVKSGAGGATGNPDEAAWKGRSFQNAAERAFHARSLMQQQVKASMTSPTVLRPKTSGTVVVPPPSPGAGKGKNSDPLGVSEKTFGDDTEAEKIREESQVGSAMRELTGQRVAVGIMAALILTVLFTYTEYDSTRPSTMIVLHNQTGNEPFAAASIQAARDTTIPDLMEYKSANQELRTYTVEDLNPDHLRPREKFRIVVVGHDGAETVAVFAYRKERRQEAVSSLLSSIFQLLVWFFGVTAFAGPVMMLVVIPIERMVTLLGMLMKDPLGYQQTSRYRKFISDGDKLVKNTMWTTEVLKGMETSFLMSTIQRIGSLMKVGFGSAGVEIIRQNLEKGQNKSQLQLHSQGTTVSCIFLFCDIRQFTDATECLQEEVFVFTNKIAAVVHSIVHSYGGSANKNIGDAFLLSWKLENLADDPNRRGLSASKSAETFTARHNQADKALLAVVKICMALYHDNYYIESMSEAARQALLSKLANRKGPVVQMGCGLHAGMTVQGAIGSQRKIDATYVSEACERAEFLEASTKKYGVHMLMSDSLHRLLHPSNRRRCRKVDQILISNDEVDENAAEDSMSGDRLELFTFDMDIEALWKKPSDGDEESESVADKKKDSRSRRNLRDDISDTDSVDSNENWPPKLVLPTGPSLYNPSVWMSDEIKTIREKFVAGATGGMFFQRFSDGLESFYLKDWAFARSCFVSILEHFEDGPSRYFFNQIEKHGGKPPPGFKNVGIVSD